MDLIRIDADVLAHYGSEEAVNAALRALIAEGRGSRVGTTLAKRANRGGAH